MASSWIGVILIGFFAGLLARFFASDPRNPQGCLLTTLLGIAGAALFTWIGQFAGMYAQGERAGFIGAVIGAVLVLLIWRALLDKRA
ncbi:GlsB/YeaQ/YmgE family stress response membrane protein [Sandaracinobacteroides sp. A072]|uniref:GlsB/YeaQ/YmgE family stress response membrane protein n=1 Tax=Sandaracinobacteroides sp. A072 TaxID=3461146 RepID=UPI004041C8C1